ncbi:MAG: GTPase HflX [Hydrogenophilales bacterium CG03_land_8_20_14_0_80_62_28]|nr:GTPase HflX [Betaproteobacteria bacterium]OIO79995.1 MAG: GTPase HflX [Hydrogenophilaceae bacterium CG1_02_62_390]PIV22788.1 MAG: GTPase HflX [Hydrogenophilales bacterium CG03_land_8_20_14_0_80_62_28]PIW39468.1 MAG: GTPase HflX [Hydrogenophilales bacterium CG15_BIG_FIL_POST_REV_8_21_14_020_62_31]PIW72681.1 MAG: GTPase HflX [Hydrogenophilales bacterium CG12_big_fil_rev_8_21_14_0_65_61_21]PIX01478.1 MAG: GTPase HflX [Hydrogenophilales bacterium CG_4_8_14_3_um_filter_62_83]PIY97647.1 MAG: GTP
MFERPPASDRPGQDRAVVLVSIDFGEPDYAESLAELKLLAGGAGLAIRAVVEAKRDRPDAALFVGSGKADEIAASAQAADAALVIFNHDLSPVQERNLEKRMQCRVLDRTALILDIFAQRARSNEGKLQVELAQLRHYATRLVRGWSHLERQKGGIGMRGGPGETQLELDRRIINAKIKNIEARLAKLGKSRALQGRARRRGGALSVSLVGYTNAGKSTLFNTLTHAGVYAADQLFATLDTTTRKVWLPDAGQVVLSDTVGFITHLPHMLVAAFHATLEETAKADLLLHVVDAASANRDRQMEEVDKVLEEIGAQDVPRIAVLNKIDLTGAAPAVAMDECGNISRVSLSARTGAGVDLLKQALVRFAQDRRRDNLQLSEVDQDGME